MDDVTIPETDPRWGAVLTLRLWRDSLKLQLATVEGSLASLERPERQRQVMDQRAEAFAHEDSRPSSTQLHASTAD